MILIAATVQVKPAVRETAVAVAREFAAASEAEPGCNRYRFFADFEDPNTFFLFEEWETEEALAAHFQTPHMAAFQEQIPQFLAGPISGKRYEVTAAEPL